jgi:hypothetical protein
MNPRILHTAAASLALLALAGCGGDDGDGEATEAPAVATTPTTTTLSKEEFLSQGDAICAEVNAALGTVGTAEGTETAALVEQEADLYTGMVDRLRALGTPDDSSGYPEFIAAADELAEAEDKAALAAAREDDVALQNAEGEVSSAFASFQAAAGDYGFEDCGSGPSTPAAGAGSGASVEAEGEEAIEGEAEVEAAPEAEEEAAPEETGGAGTEAGGGAEAGGGTGTGGESGSGGGGSGGIGPG